MPHLTQPPGIADAHAVQGQKITLCSASVSSSWLCTLSVSSAPLLVVPRPFRAPAAAAASLLPGPSA